MYRVSIRITVYTSISITGTDQPPTIKYNIVTMSCYSILIRIVASVCPTPPPPPPPPPPFPHQITKIARRWVHVWARDQSHLLIHTYMARVGYLVMGTGIELVGELDRPMLQYFIASFPDHIPQLLSHSVKKLYDKVEPGNKAMKSPPFSFHALHVPKNANSHPNNKKLIFQDAGLSGGTVRFLPAPPPPPPPPKFHNLQ